VPEHEGERETHRREDAAFEHLCAVLTEHERRPVTVVSHPDRGGVAGGCDAILQRGSLRVAAEHTCIHSIGERPRFPLIWKQIAPTLTERIRSTFPNDWIRLWIPVRQLPRSRRWPEMIDTVAAAVVASVPTMPLDSELKVDVPALGVQVLVGRLKPHGRGVCSMSWLVPGQTEDYAIEDMRRAIREKRKTLLAYRREVDQTLLLLDSEECGWPVQFMEAFLEAARAETPDAFDDIYLACTMSTPIILFPFKWGEVLMPTPEERKSFHEAESRVNSPHFEEERRFNEEYARELRALMEERRKAGQGYVENEED